MNRRIQLILIAVLLAFHHLPVYSVPVDVDGDGIVGPLELIDLSLNWKGPAEPLITQPWQINGSDIYFSTGKVAIGTSSAAFPLTLSTPSGYGWVHTNGECELGSFVNSTGGWLGTRSDHPLHFFTHDSSSQMILTQNGTLGIGTSSPSSENRLESHQAGSGSAVLGVASNGTGVSGQSTNGAGVKGTSTSSQGILGVSTSGIGIDGQSNSNTGISGTSVGGTGVYGQSTNGTGLYGTTSSSSGDDAGVVGAGPGGAGAWAGLFKGPVHILSDLYVEGGINGKRSGLETSIDHPLDPANKNLSHISVESSDRVNIYSGNTVTDATGYATVSLPEWFEALNGDFRYQLTVIGQFAQAIVDKKIQNNRFSIRTDKPNVEVSWQVTGVRQDAWAKSHPIIIEKDKSDKEKAQYAAPEVTEQP